MHFVNPATLGCRVDWGSFHARNPPCKLLFTENEAAGVVLKWLPLNVYTFPCAAGPAVVCQLLDLIEQNPQFWHFFETATGKRPGSWS